MNYDEYKLASPPESKSNTSLAMCSCGRMVEVSENEPPVCDSCKENEAIEENN